MYGLAFLGSFVSVFLKGFQHKNVIHNLYGSTFVTSYFMAFMDVLLIGLIARSGWDIAFFSGGGASLGMVASMYVHNRYFKPKLEAEAAKAEEVARGVFSQQPRSLPDTQTAWQCSVLNHVRYVGAFDYPMGFYGQPAQAQARGRDYTSLEDSTAEMLRDLDKLVDVGILTREWAKGGFTYDLLVREARTTQPDWDGVTGRRATDIKGA